MPEVFWHGLSLNRKLSRLERIATERWFGDAFLPNQAMKLFKILLIVLDIALALAAAFVLFPTLMEAASTIPIALAVLLGAGLMLIIYGD